jgi:hypothetical protein
MVHPTAWSTADRAEGRPMIPASLLNFLSGLAAGAGINLLTSITGGSTESHTEIVIDSFIWIAVAVFLAYAAHLSEATERDAALVIDSNLSHQEKRVIFKDQASRVRWRYRAALGLGAISTIGAIGLIPGLGL